MWRCRSMCWHEWCSSILGLESHAYFILPNSSFNGLVDTGPEDTSTASSCDLVMPWCDWHSVPRTFSLSDGGVMRTSLWNMSPSSTVSDSQCCQWGCSGCETSLMSLGQPELMMSARACISTSISKVSWKASFQSGNRQTWWMVRNIYCSYAVVSARFFCMVESTGLWSYSVKDLP